MAVARAESYAMAGLCLLLSGCVVGGGVYLRWFIAHTRASSGAVAKHDRNSENGTEELLFRLRVAAFGIGACLALQSLVWMLAVGEGALESTSVTHILAAVSHLLFVSALALLFYLFTRGFNNLMTRCKAMLNLAANNKLMPSNHPSSASRAQRSQAERSIGSGGGVGGPGELTKSVDNVAYSTSSSKPSQLEMN